MRELLEVLTAANTLQPELMHVGSSWDIAELTAIPCQVTAALKVSLLLTPWLKQTLG